MEWMKCMEWKRVHQTLIICHIIHLVIFFFFLLLRRCFRIRVVHLHESCIQRSAVNLIDYHAISFSLKSLIIVHHKNIATLFRITFWMWLLWAFRNDDSFADTSIFQGKVLLREKKKIMRNVISHTSIPQIIHKLWVGSDAAFWIMDLKKSPLHIVINHFHVILLLSSNEDFSRIWISIRVNIVSSLCLHME